MTAHDNRYVNAGKAAVVKVDAGKSQGYEPSGGTKTRAMVRYL